MIDIIFYALILIFFLIGVRDGFFRTLTGPLALIIGTILCMIYYQQTKNLVMALTISAVSPFIIKMLLNWLLKLWNSIKKGEEELSLGSRIWGGLLSTFWSGSILAITLVIIAIIPVQFKWMAKLQNTVIESQSFKLINAMTGNRINARSMDIKETMAFFQNPDKIKKLQASAEFKSLTEHPKIKEIFSDHEILKYFDEKNYTQLFMNPKIQSILEDKELLKKIYQVNKRVVQEKIDEKINREEE